MAGPKPQKHPLAGILDPQDLEMGAWVQTFSGRRVNVLDPNPDDILIQDIARSLSMQCRFIGQINQFYPVAQHLVRASYMVPEPLALCALMHDASEAYLQDIIRPIKKLKLFGPYLAIEDNFMNVLAEKFDFQWPMPPQVKWADDALLWNEAAFLVNGPKEDWKLPREPRERCCPNLSGSMTPKEAEDLFLIRFFSLSKGTTSEYLQQFISNIRGVHEQSGTHNLRRRW